MPSLQKFHQENPIRDAYNNASFDERVAFIKWFLLSFLPTHARLMCGLVRDKKRCPFGHEVKKEEEIEHGITYPYNR